MEALVTAAKNGDKEAFVQLIRINKQSMYKAAWVYLRNEQDIADALQNTILSCYEKIQGLREVKYFKTWLMRILINELTGSSRSRCANREYCPTVSPTGASAASYCSVTRLAARRS